MKRSRKSMKIPTIKRTMPVELRCLLAALSDDDTWAPLSQFQYHDGFIYATNGFMAARLPLQAEAGEEPIKEGLYCPFIFVESGELKPDPEFEGQKVYSQLPTFFDTKETERLGPVMCYLHVPEFFIDLKRNYMLKNPTKKQKGDGNRAETRVFLDDKLNLALHKTPTSVVCFNAYFVKHLAGQDVEVRVRRRNTNLWPILFYYGRELEIAVMPVRM